MWILDTDHLSVLERGGPASMLLQRKLDQSGWEPAVTVVILEEQLRGWLAQIKRARNSFEEIRSCGNLLGRFRFFEEWHISPWDEAATAVYSGIRSSCLRVGTMDLRIASIAIANRSTLLTRNLADFGQVPGLRLENWLDLN